jgi:hypothetical protein
MTLAARNHDHAGARIQKIRKRPLRVSFLSQRRAKKIGLIRRRYGACSERAAPVPRETAA